MKKVIEVDLKGIMLYGVQTIQITSTGECYPENIQAFDSVEACGKYIEDKINILEEHYGEQNVTIINRGILNLYKINVNFENDFVKDNFTIIYKIATICL